MGESRDYVGAAGLSSRISTWSRGAQLASNSRADLRALAGTLPSVHLSLQAAAPRRKEALGQE